MQILVAVVSGFASGVFLRSLFFFSGWSLAFFCVLAALFGAAAFFKSRPAYIFCALFCLFLVAGTLRATNADTPLPETFVRDVRHRVSYQAVVVADPDVRDTNQRIQVRVTAHGASTRMLAVAPRYPSVAVGDQVFVSGTLQIPQPFADDNGRIFHYDKYLQRDGVRFILNFAYIRVESSAPWYSVPAALARVKHMFVTGIRAALPEPYASLAGGVVIGGKSGLGNELKDAFIRSGLIQIIVLSGYNVMIIAEWIMAALARTSLSRRWGAAAGAVAILVFVGIAGASATALRALLMACIALYARATSHTYAAGRALLFAVLLMLAWNPLYLVFDPGFGLSVVATAGLIWLAPIIEKVLQAKKEKLFGVTPSTAPLKEGAEHSQKPLPRIGFLVNALATTLAAQIAVLPLLLYATGNLSLVAIPANVITMPVVPLAMFLSALAGFAGMLFGTIAPLFGIVFAFPAYLANAYLIFVAQKAAELPFAAFTLPALPFWFVLVAYAALIYFVASSYRFSTTDQLRLVKKASI